MASYQPPTEQLPTFNSAVFDVNTEALTYDVATKKFLKFPTAQGTESLLNTNVNGSLQVTGAVGVGTTQTFASKVSIISTATDTIAIGNGTGATQGAGCVAIGSASATSTQGVNSVAIGSGTGLSQVASSVAIGNMAGQSQTGPSGSIAIGNRAGYNQNGGDVSVGTYTTVQSQIQVGASNISLGPSAGVIQSGSCIAIGNNAGANQAAANAIAIGYQSGQTQNNNDISIGKFTATTQSQNADNNISLGTDAGKIQNGGSIAIGFLTGNSQATGAISIGKYTSPSTQTQASNAISIGLDCGKIQTGSCIAIGNNAGANQAAVYAIAIGCQSGQAQSESDISIGKFTATTQAQTGKNNISLGTDAGLIQAGGCIAIGYNSGGATQGANNTAVGSGAGAGAGVNGVFLGLNSGTLNGTASYNTYLGAATNTTNGNSWQASTAIGYGAQITASYQTVLGTAGGSGGTVICPATIQYSKVTPLYTAIPTYTSADIGYTFKPVITINNGAGVSWIPTTTVPMGVWLLTLDLYAAGTSLSGTVTISIVGITVSNLGSTINAIKIPTFQAGTDGYNVTSVFSQTNATAQAMTVSTQLANTYGTVSYYIFQLTRIA